MTKEEAISRIEELEAETKKNADDFKNGDLSYEELHSMQYLLFKEIEGIKEQFSLDFIKDNIK
jgi:hypothetical protein